LTLESKVLVDAYIEWLKSKITIADIEGYKEITTPFLDRHNDHIQIYIKQKGDKLILSDDAYIIGDLVSAGCDVSSPRRKAVLTTILNGFGVILTTRNALMIEATLNDFAQKKHSLLQAMISVNDMFMMSSSRVMSLFLEDVEKYLDIHDVRYTPSVQFVGKSGFSHRFDFVIPASKTEPERLLRAINNPTRDNATGVLFAWNDTRQVRKRESSMFVMLNDLERRISADIVRAFTQYDVEVIQWSKRQEYLKRLAS